TTLAKTINDGVFEPRALALTSTGKLFIANGSNDVTVYPAGKTSPRRTIYNGVGNPIALLLDQQSRLFVDNATQISPSGGKGTVTIYKSNGQLIETIYDGLHEPRAILLGSSQV
ncbi:MAG TPA: hypothetical protein VGF18_07285, partial [Candidatus Tumulicola sp.]